MEKMTIYWLFMTSAVWHETQPLLAKTPTQMFRWVRLLKISPLCHVSCAFNSEPIYKNPHGAFKVSFHGQVGIWTQLSWFLAHHSIHHTVLSWESHVPFMCMYCKSKCQNFWVWMYFLWMQQDYFKRQLYIYIYIYNWDSPTTPHTFILH